MNTGRRVVCAANRYNGTIILGARHFDHIMHTAIANMLPELKPESSSEWEQGFIDTCGDFLTREEAYIVAVFNKQIIRPTVYTTDKLFSENLY